MKNDSVFQLVRSMSARERGYFKRFAGAHSERSGQNYIRLFDAIDAQARKGDVYDEEKIRTSFAGETFVKQLHVTKNYLHKLLLKSLVTYSAEGPEHRIQFRLMEIGILYRKGLYKQCRKLIMQTEKSALKLEDWSSLLTLAGWHYSLMMAQRIDDETVLEADALFERENGWLEQQGLLVQHRQLNMRLNVMFSREGFVRTKKQLVAYKKLLQDPLLQVNPTEAGFKTQLNYYDTVTSACVMMGRYKEAFGYAKTQLALFDDEQRKAYLDRYLIACNNLLLCLIQLGKYKQCFKKLARFQAIPLENKDQHLWAFTTLRRNELRAYISMGHFAEGVEAAKKVEAELLQHSGQVDMEMELNFYFYLYNFYFGLGDYHTALAWLNRILNHKGFVREDMRNFARLLEVITHFELRNYLYLESVVNSLVHFTKKLSPSSFGELMLWFFAKLKGEEHGSKAFIAACKKLRKKLRRLDEKDPERRYLEYFDVESWLTSHLKGLTFAEVIREKQNP